jgi:hypothetical protein
MSDFDIRTASMEELDQDYQECVEEIRVWEQKIQLRGREIQLLEDRIEILEENIRANRTIMQMIENERQRRETSDDI